MTLNFVKVLYETIGLSALCAQYYSILGSIMVVCGLKNNKKNKNRKMSKLDLERMVQTVNIL